MNDFIVTQRQKFLQKVLKSARVNKRGGSCAVAASSASVTEYCLALQWKRVQQSRHSPCSASTIGNTSCILSFSFVILIRMRRRSQTKRMMRPRQGLSDVGAKDISLITLEPDNE
jgi:hypothetical protein